MTKEQILEIVRQLYLDKITPGTAVDLLYEQLSAERERAGKLVEALKRVDALSFNPTVNRIIKQTINDYDTATKES